MANLETVFGEPLSGGTRFEPWA